MSKPFIFPKDFLWGSATSAYQTEGNNDNTDWWEWEQRTPKTEDNNPEPSGIACDSYNRYEEDFKLAKKLNQNAIRISVEWARIEPQEGVFDQKEIEHYQKVLQSAQEQGLKTYVTLHHFTNPIWFSKLGGWTSMKSAFYFARYAKKCAENFNGWVDTFLTINEPQVYALMSYTVGTWPPNKKNYWYSLIVQINFMRAHRAAYDAIKEVKAVPVGIVNNIVWYEIHNKKFHVGWLLETLIAKLLFFLNTDFFMKPILNKTDVIGLNYYFTNRIKGFGLSNPNAFVSDLNWWIDPKGLENVLLYLKKYNKDIFITENGLADSQDRIRSEFINVMLTACANAIDKAVPLKGYFHWSLLDNYEWHHGFWPRFGLVEIDRSNDLKRKPRKSAEFYARICKENKINRQSIE